MQTTKVNLAQEPDCALGGVHVSPSRGLVSDGAVEERVAPQVMQALLVLLRAEGRTVTRDELVDACWDGRVVSDDAINRVIALLRGLARQFDPPPFQLETIPKIGFRLDAAAPRDAGSTEAPPVGIAPPVAPQAPPGRRALIGAAAAAVLAGVGGAGWWVAARRLPTPARDAIEAGWAAFRQMTPDHMAQAIVAFQRATALAPRHAEGWGFLALAYQYQSQFARADEAPLLAQRAGEAAKRALAIEPGNAEAEAALAALRPTADWIGTGAAVAALLARHPRNFSANSVAMVFYNRAGQLELGVRCAQAALAADAAWPRLYSALAQGSWSMGRLNEADDWIARGFSQWPRYYTLWFGRQRLLTYTGRAAQALDMIDDVGRRPLGIPEWNFDLCRLESRALLTRAPADIAAAAAGYRAVVSRSGFAQNAIQFLSAMGQLDEAFTVLDALLFDRGRRLGPLRFSPEQGRYYSRDHRETGILWTPQVAAMRADPRMLPIVRNIGLAEYWRVTGSRPATPIAGL